MPLPRWGDIREFCLKQGYEERRTDHFRYQKILPDLSLSGTVVSFGKDGVVLKPDLWLRVSKRQLRLASEEDFWSGLAGGPVGYDVRPAPPVTEPLPDYLVRFLESVCHYSEAQIQATGREEAQPLLNQHYSKPLKRS